MCSANHECYCWAQPGKDVKYAELEAQGSRASGMKVPSLYSQDRMEYCATGYASNQYHTVLLAPQPRYSTVPNLKWYFWLLGHWSVKQNLPVFRYQRSCIWYLCSGKMLLNTWADWYLAMYPLCHLCEEKKKTLTLATKKPVEALRGSSEHWREKNEHNNKHTVNGGTEHSDQRSLWEWHLDTDMHFLIDARMAKENKHAMLAFYTLWK